MSMPKKEPPEGDAESTGWVNGLRPLGRLEVAVMEVVWTKGKGRVREVAQNLHRRLAYTTVMTTLDRLFKKGLLQRSKEEQAFVYSPRVSRQEWEQRRVDKLVSDFLSAPGASRELLFSWFLKSVGKQDAELLDQLEQEIRTKRKELRGGEER